jgi:prepilin-type N-terminal cleavage/methylation domain-containing protein
MKKSAFTLIELLVVIAIVAVLASLSFVVAGKMMEQGYLAREIGSGRNLMAGFLAYSADNNMEIMPGYMAKPGRVTDDHGQSLTFPSSGRYPWRLAKYLKASPKGTLIVNQQARLTENKDHGFYTYVVSLLPNLGMNVTFVGGDETGNLAPTNFTRSVFGDFCLTNLNQAVHASSQIVFCSAHYSQTGEGAFGFHMVTAPYTTSRNWAPDYKPDLPPARTGYVHFRYNGRAVAAMLDGHTEMLDFEQMQDMRRWCNPAADNNDPKYTLTATQ